MLIPRKPCAKLNSVEFYRGVDPLLWNFSALTNPLLSKGNIRLVSVRYLHLCAKYFDINSLIYRRTNISQIYIFIYINTLNAHRKKIDILILILLLSHVPSPFFYYSQKNYKNSLNFNN